uniref:MIF4G domain-containing protein n=1 Tax=Salix viminalis TaxID=40686 RepID=A0A6N2M2N8_SALVM
MEDLRNVNLSKFVSEAVTSICDAKLRTSDIQVAVQSLHQMEHEDVKMFNAKGEPSDDNVSSYEKLRKSYDHLYRNVSSLAEALDMQPPVMPEDGHTTRVTSGEDASSSAAGKDTNALEALWDDEDTRAFYECLPDLSICPAVLLGEAEPKANEHSVKTQDQSNELATESDQGQPTQDMAEVSAESGTLREGKGTEKEKDKEEKDKEKVKDPEKEKGKEKDPEKEKGKEKDAERKGENDKEKLKSLEGANLDALLQRLPGCVSRDLIDQLTVDFCYVNSKLSRKKLVRALFNVPRTSLELLPYYSRMVATLSTCMKDVSSMLLQMLEEEFNFLINKKDMNTSGDNQEHYGWSERTRLAVKCLHARFLIQKKRRQEEVLNLLQYTSICSALLASVSSSFPIGFLSEIIDSKQCQTLESVLASIENQENLQTSNVGPEKKLSSHNIWSRREAAEETLTQARRITH